MKKVKILKHERYITEGEAKIFSKDEVGPCIKYRFIPDGEGLFHQWAENESPPQAIIEREDGRIELVNAECIQFCVPGVED